MTAQLCCSYLRVYQALRTFPEPERRRLEAALDTGRVEEATRGAHRSALGLVAASERAEVREKVVDEVRYVCPANTRLRMLLGMLAMHRTLPESVAQVFFAPQEMETARQELEHLRSERPLLRPYLLQSVWHVPLHWFICFEDGERRIEHDGDRLRIRYETAVGRAQSRVLRALEALRARGVHTAIVGVVEELNEWLAGFDAGCLLELDYASVSSLFDSEELADDHSAGDVWNAIGALAARDGLRAGLYYQRVNERWAPKRACETLN